MGYPDDTMDINDIGQVVGTTVTEVTIQGFITGPDGMGMRGLGTLGGDFSSAWGINDVGQVVGWSLTAGDQNTLQQLHAFITGPDGMGMRDLGTLGEDDSLARDINEAGQVVGWSHTAEGPLGLSHAFLPGPDGEGMMDLNSLLDLPEGVILTEAIDINNNGQVLAVMTVPELEIYALMLAGLGLIGFMAWRKKAATNVERRFQID